MDKYQRKQMVRWEKTKAKTERQFEERKKETESRRGWDKVAIAVEKYTPCQASVFAEALKLLKDPVFRSLQNIYHMMFFLGPDLNGPIYTFSGRRVIAPPPPEIEEAIRKGRQRKLTECAIDLIPTLNRHLDRVDTIRGELLFKAQRNRVIQDCLAIKEELMMKAWHPNRVGRILEMYGWEVLDNLFGIE